MIYNDVVLKPAKAGDLTSIQSYGPCKTSINFTSPAKYMQNQHRYKYRYFTWKITLVVL